MLTGRLAHRKTSGSDVPVELRFVDMLLIIIATLMFVAVLLAMVSAFAGSAPINLTLRISTRSAPVALTGLPYELRLAAAGGDGSYSWRVAAGRLPAGMFLISDGTVSGAPVQVGSATATIEVVDGQQRSARRQIIFGVLSSGSQPAQPRLPPHVVNYAISLPVAVNGRPYRYDLLAQGGMPPYHWILAAGKLPAGFSLTAHGNLTGRPQNSGTTTFTLRLVDSAGNDVTQRVILTVRDAPLTIWQRILHWLQIIVTIIGLLVLLGLIAIFLYDYIHGTPPSSDPGTPSLRERIRRRRERATR